MFVDERSQDTTFSTISAAHGPDIANAYYFNVGLLAPLTRQLNFFAQLRRALGNARPGPGQWFAVDPEQVGLQHRVVDDVLAAKGIDRLVPDLVKHPYQRLKSVARRKLELAPVGWVNPVLAGERIAEVALVGQVQT